MPRTEPAPRPPRIESDAYEISFADFYNRSVTQEFLQAAGGVEELFHAGYDAGFRHGAATLPPCGVLGCHIAESSHRHEKTAARIDDDYARGIRDAAAMFEGRGHVPKKAVHASILSLLQAVQR